MILCSISPASLSSGVLMLGACGDHHGVSRMGFGCRVDISVDSVNSRMRMRIHTVPSQALDQAAIRGSPCPSTAVLLLSLLHL
jgi:hypothetical protein